MKNGIRRADVDELQNQIDSADLEGGQRETVEEELEATREREVELRAQIERLSTMLSRSQESLCRFLQTTSVLPCPVHWKSWVPIL